MKSKRPIIVIDGYAPTCTSMADILRDEGYCADCLLQLQTAEQLGARQPALIILELQLLYYEETLRLIEQLRQHQATRATPVLVTTTSARLPESLVAALNQLHCTLLLKPFDIDTFLTRVVQSLGEDRRPAIGGWCLPVLV